MTMIDVTVKGFKLYCEDEHQELYDFFVPNKDYRMTISQANVYVPEMHKLIAVKRDTKQYEIRYSDLLELQEK